MRMLAALAALALASCYGSTTLPSADADAHDVADTTTDTAADTSADPGSETPADVPPDTGIDPLPDSVDVVHDPLPDGLTERGECRTSSDCSGLACVRVPDEPGGYWLCSVPARREATECTSTDPWVDRCCDSTQCISGENGGCFYSDWGWGFCGGAIMPHNTCVYDECDDDSDCTAGPRGICLPANIQDWPRRRCAYGTCRTLLDCASDGFCAPLWDFCCDWRVTGFFCMYPGNCQRHTDCTDYMACVGDLATGGTRCETIACPM